ncbi:MAG: methyltransferase domain-containing protein [Frankiaceae bacterium]|nr:methyltransferase domain-containing protein [Frankiaceae bacterium]MBV9871495.1 methyltransferase domain-containing protein [Frankiaceae bacterium]
MTGGLRATTRAKLFGARRRFLSYRFVRGEGLEIGALGSPLRVRNGVKVRYVDRFDHEGLIEQYPEAHRDQLVSVDIIDDGEVLSTQPDGSADFIVANHFIEHAENTVGTLENLCRVLRPGGILYLAVPDRHRTFDKDRPPTPLDHIERDYRDGPGWSRHAHQEEWARLVERAPESSIVTRVADLERLDYAIHYHVWDRAEFRALVEHASSRLGLPLEVVTTVRNGFEFIVILRKTSARAKP